MHLLHLNIVGMLTKVLICSNIIAMDIPKHAKPTVVNIISNISYID
jgi:hypothetical protein